MKQNDRWKFLLVVAILFWSLWSIGIIGPNSPKSRRPGGGLSPRGRSSRDAAFTNILQRLQPLQAARPEREFSNLQEAIGTNSITPYFPFFDAKNEVHPNTFILNQLQREASGKIKLGLDLQGGTSFLVEMDTNSLVYVETVTNKSTGVVETITNLARVEGALSQAVEVLRKRVDAFGVAEPIIQPAGGNRILIQLPGLVRNPTRQSAQDQHSKIRVSGIPDGEGGQLANTSTKKPARFSNPSLRVMWCSNASKPQPNGPPEDRSGGGQEKGRDRPGR